MISVWATATRAYAFLCHSLWALAIALLPITSLPLIVEATRSTTVGPPTAFLLAALAGLWLAPRLLRGGSLPAEGLPLAGFTAAALLSWAGSFFLSTPPFRQRSVFPEALEAFATLALGLLVYYTASAWLAAGKDRLQTTFRLVNLSGALMLAWGLVQAYFVIFNNGDYPFALTELQRWFSARQGDPLVLARITSFAYEPSWLAHMLNLIYLPYWLAATALGYSAQRKVWKFSLEHALLALGLFTLYFSFSRIGWITFLLMAAALALGANLRLAGKMQTWLMGKLRLGEGGRRAARWGLPLLLSALLLAAYAALGVGMLYMGTKFEPRLAKIFEDNPFARDSFYEVVNELAFAERVVYWDAGLRSFSDHPLLGVGPGNAGFYFAQNAPAYGWYLPEITRLITRQDLMPNIKSFWVRLLAENGLLGFGLFLSWFALLGRSAGLARASGDPLLRLCGLFGLLALLAFTVEGFSVDSYALPYFWLAAGIISATGFHARSTLNVER